MGEKTSHFENSNTSKQEKETIVPVLGRERASVDGFRHAEVGW